MSKLNRRYRELIIKILEDIGRGKTLKYNNYSITKECFGSILNYIKAKDLARGICILRRNRANNVQVFGSMNPYLTINGVDYLNKNL